MNQFKKNCHTELSQEGTAEGVLCISELKFFISISSSPVHCIQCGYTTTNTVTELFLELYAVV